MAMPRTKLEEVTTPIDRTINNLNVQIMAYTSISRYLPADKEERAGVYRNDKTLCNNIKIISKDVTHINDRLTSVKQRLCKMTTTRRIFATVEQIMEGYELMSVLMELVDICNANIQPIYSDIMIALNKESTND